MSLRARLLLAAIYILVVVVAGLEIPLAVSIKNRQTQDFEQVVLTNSALLAARINDDVPKAGSDPATPPTPQEVIDRIVDDTAAGTGARFVVTDRLGRIISDSSDEAAVGAQYETPQRPEFADVLSEPGGRIFVGIRHSATLGTDLVVVGVPVVHFREAIGVVRASAPLDMVQADVRRLWAALGAIGLVAIAAGLTATWFLATSMSRPVRRLEEAAVRLGEGDLESRAEPAGPEEVATLARSFNQMADTLSANMAAQRDFLANASHQLRTPLTGLRLRLEAIQAEGGTGSETGKQAKKAEGEVDRLARLVQDLLTLARATSAESRGAPVQVHELAAGAVERWAAPAAEAGKTVLLASAHPAVVWADPTDLEYVLDNLIENAIRYTPTGGHITVEAGTRDGTAFFSVSDDGPGIPEAERRRIFERFYRGHAGLSSGPGTGLGLAIAQELSRRWGGELRLGDGAQTRFVSSFPARPAIS